MFTAALFTEANSQDVEAPEMPISGQVDKEKVERTHKGMLSSL
jgi:hypothetical protein